MNNKYLEHIAEIENKPVAQYVDIPIGSLAYDMLIASGIFVAMVLGISIPDIAKEIEEPQEKVDIIFDNIEKAGYIDKNGYIVLNIEDINDHKMIAREYHLFVMAGIGLVKKC